MAEECSPNEYAVRGAEQPTLGAMLTIHDVANHADYCCLKILGVMQHIAVQIK